jgi:thiol-disulfide isomerase/thioredoxin
LSCAWLFGCAASQTGAHPVASASKSKRARPASDQPAQLYLEPGQESRGARSLEDVRFVGMDDGPVPDFRLRAIDGRWLDSHQLVGERPFVVVFFATWCAVCDLKMPLLRQALAATGPVDVIGVSVDDARTLGKVAPYLKHHGLTNVPIVPARSFPTFAVSYNPFSTVPLVVVVGQNGGLVDYQVGYSPDDEQRLEAAVRLAKRIGPLKAAD